MGLWIKKHAFLIANKVHIFIYGIPPKFIVKMYLDSRRIKKFEGNILSVANTYVNDSKVKDLVDIQLLHNKLARERIRQILMKIQREVKENIMRGK